MYKGGFGIIFGLIFSLVMFFLSGFFTGSKKAEELTLHYEIDFKGDECQIMNEKFVICKYKSLDDLEITDFKGVTRNEK